MNYYTEKEVREMLGKIKWEDFIAWMFGKTVPVINGKCAYYKIDVDIFIHHNK